MDEWRVLNC